MFAATLALIVFRPAQQPALELGLLAAGLIAGAVFLRFGVPRVWMVHLVLLAFMVITFMLGKYFIGWFFGFGAGANLGVAWRALATREKATYPWTVDGKGYAAVPQVRKAALAALHSLDGKKNWRLIVEHGAARFDASGSADGVVCHRTPDADKVGTWAILERPGETGTETVAVPVGGLTGTIPAQYVTDIATAEAELGKFLQDPDGSAPGPEWSTDQIAEDLHLGS